MTAIRIALVALFILSSFMSGPVQAFPAYLEGRVQSYLGHTQIPGGHASPSIADLNGDGLPDLIVSNQLGDVGVFYGGVADEDLTAQGVEQFWDYETGQPVNLGLGAHVTAIELGGSMALIYGNATGQVGLCYKPFFIGQPKPEVEVGTGAYVCAPYLHDGNGELIKVPSHAAPLVVDYDGDGDRDLLVGAGDGLIYEYTNIGDDSSVVLVPMGPLSIFDPVTRKDVNIDVGSRATPASADLDHDGRADLVIGNTSGHLTVCMGEAEACFPLVSHSTAAFGPINTGPYSAPALADIDPDGGIDLIVGNQSGEIILYRGFDIQGEDYGSVAESVLFDTVKQNGQALSVPARPTVMDYNKDAACDTAIPDGKGGILIGFSNSMFEAARDRYIRVRTAEMEILKDLGSDIQISTMDYNQDGRMDFVVGKQDGSVHLCLNVSPVRSPSDMLVSCSPLTDASGNGITVPGGNAAPVMADGDQDGDLELVIGSGDGRVYIYFNNGSANAPLWNGPHPFYRHFPDEPNGILDVGTNAVPALADLNLDGYPELVVGSGDGSVLVCNAYDPDCFPLVVYQDGAVAPLRLNGPANPTIADVNKDGLPDLLIGDGVSKLYIAYGK